MADLTAAGVITAIISIMCMILSTILLVYFYRNICNNQTTNMDKSNKKLTITSTIMFTSFALAVTIRGFGYIAYLSGSDAWTSIDAFGTIFWTIGILGIISVFILRIVYTFTESLSVFAYSPTTIKALYASFAVSIILVIIGFIIYYFYQTSGSQGSVVALFILTVILFIQYYINYVVCFILFTKKIVVIINYKMDNYQKQNIELEPQLSATNTNTATPETPQDDDERVNNNQVIEVKSIDSLIRYALLVLIGCISTLIVFLNGIIQISIEANQSGFSDLTIQIDSIVNMLCICLLFEFGEGLYYRLCSCCDTCLKNCFVKRILRNRDEENDPLTVQQSKTLLFKTI